MDEDYYNTLAAEERLYRKQVNERKNFILTIRDFNRKKEQWDLLFPKQEVDDRYLEGTIF